MKIKTRPLLCEFHAHTTWSDGTLSVPELVDLYGRAGFDVLCVTDHVIRSDDPYRPARVAGPEMLHRDNHAAYLAEIALSAQAAMDRYGMLVLPGLELTYNDEDPFRAAHAVAVGCDVFVSVDQGIETAMLRARRSGAAIIAAHPHTGDGGHRGSGTRKFSMEWQELDPLIDRYELFNGRELFAWVAEAGLLGVANGDFHRAGDLNGWKTLVPCAATSESVVSFLRSNRPAYLARVEAGDLLGRLAGAPLARAS